MDSPPAHFMCIELVPLVDDVSVFEGLNTAQLFDLAVTRPDRFRREWTMFHSLPEAEAYADRSATLTVLPLVIEHNPLLGY